MSKPCPYCGSKHLNYSFKDYFSHREQYAYTCPQCHLCFFHYKESIYHKEYFKQGEKHEQEQHSTSADHTSEAEALSATHELISKGDCVTACQMLYELPSPYQNPLPLLVYRLIADIAYYGGLCEKTVGELKIIKPCPPL